ncbi:MAG: tryptophan-rich sensory protein [Aggregatilineales bacterium]
MNKDLLRQIFTIFAFAGTVAVNGLANALPLNGQTTGAISDRFPVYFVPAGYVFSIWGVIYLLLLGFTVFQALPSQRENPLLRRIGYWFVVGSVANSAWIFLWHYEQFGLTLLAMVGLLATLIAIYLRLNIGRAAVSAATRWLVHLPFSVYLGWITVATVANVTTVLYIANWDGFGLSAEAWALIMLVAGGLIASAMIATRRDVAYTLVILWAYIGIVVKQSGTPEVALGAGVIAGVVAVALVLARARLRAQSRPGAAQPA